MHLLIYNWKIIKKKNKHLLQKTKHPSLTKKFLVWPLFKIYTENKGSAIYLCIIQL